jgi:Ras-related protein Rab-1A
MNYDQKCQLLIIGDSTVGKTSILNKFANGTFNENYLATVGLDNITKDETIDGKNIRIKIWDTAGQERYKALTKGFFNNAEGIMIVFDVTNTETYENLKNWIQSIQTFMGNKMEEIPIIIIGNKIDCEEREVKTEDAESYCKGQNYPYFETSAKTGENIDKTIRFLVKKVIEGNIDNNQNEGTGNNNLRLSKEELKKKEGGGCNC